MSSTETVLSAKNIKKYYGATHANDDLSIDLNGGEIRGLIGENGSGKSTLISIIAGITMPDSGTMAMNGAPYQPKDSLDSGKNRIGTVVQELGLVDGLPAGVNIFLGRSERFTKAGIINMEKLYAEAAALFDKWGFPGFPVSRATGLLTIEEKKIVELMRALSIDPQLLILDEITQMLSLNYRRIFIDIINKLKAENKSILMVTHDVEEMVELTDCITIMRDGKIVAERRCDSTTPDEIKRLMVGRDLEGSYYREDKTESYEEKVVLRAEHLTSHYFKDVSFELHEREILGFCGLSDAGIHELAESLFAVRPAKSGNVTVVDENTVIKTPMQAMKLRMGYVPKDRDKQALMTQTTIEDNVALPTVEMIRRRVGFLHPQVKHELSEKVMAMFDVKASGISQVMSGLSGGNRQKVNLGRWLIQGKTILILDCPTRGVDVGVKSYIYHEMIELKKQGVSMLVFSDELPELIGMCDRLIVMKRGKIEKTMKRSEGFSEEAIIEVML
jgi:ribose transport system ATP-binding protein